MRLHCALLGLALFGSLSVAGQQPGLPTELEQQAPTAVVRDRHSTKADKAVPLCPATFDDSLATDGIASKKDTNVRGPVPKNSVTAETSPEAREAPKKLREAGFAVFVSLVVDTSGNPKESCVMKSAGYGLDALAIKAAMLYRFEPATQEGKPVQYRVTIQVNTKVF